MCNCVCSTGDNNMATNLAINPKLLDEALLCGRLKTKKATVEQALLEFIQRRRQKQILRHFGTLEWNRRFDYKKERSR